MMGEIVYYLNGAFVPAGEASLPLGDLAIVRGFGVFDFLRTYGHEPFMLREHVERLLSSASQVGLEMPWSASEIESIVRETNERNGLADVTIRIVATGGLSTNYMMPQNKTSLAVMVHPVAAYPARLYADGASVVTTDVERIFPTVKSINYLGAIVAVRAAEKAGAIEAIYRTRDGRVTEGTRSNLFLVRDGKLLTPARDILPGITRMATIEAVAGEYDVIEADITYDELLAADEVFLTSTTKEVMPVSRVDAAVIGNGRAGECTQDIADRFRALVKARTTEGED